MLLFTDKLSPDRVKLVMEHIWRMQEFCNSMSILSPDSFEYAYLKAIVLFSPGTQTLLDSLVDENDTAQIDSHTCLTVFLPDHPGINNTPQIERFQEKAYMELQDYVTTTYPEDCYR